QLEQVKQQKQQIEQYFHNKVIKLKQKLRLAYDTIDQAKKDGFLESDPEPDEERSDSDSPIGELGVPITMTPEIGVATITNHPPTKHIHGIGLDEWSPPNGSIDVAETKTEPNVKTDSFNHFCMSCSLFSSRKKKKKENKKKKKWKARPQRPRWMSNEMKEIPLLEPIAQERQYSPAPPLPVRFHSHPNPRSRPHHNHNHSHSHNHNHSHNNQQSLDWHSDLSLLNRSRKSVNVNIRNNINVSDNGRSPPVGSKAWWKSLSRKAQENDQFAQESNAAHWTMEEVAYWLKSVNLEEYAPQFIQGNVNGEMLLKDLDIDMMTQHLKIKELHCKRLLRDIEKLRTVCCFIIRKF
ncbi:RNA-binding protein, partial [Reticulomyxa filosa]